MNTDELFSVKDKVVVVTGASSGIGASAALAFAERGAHVIAVARRAERLNELAGRTTGITPFVGDVTDADSRTELVAHVMNARGRLDVLVNNAGIAPVVPALDESVDDFRRVIETNLVSVFGLSREAGRVMVDAGRGTIINIASIFGVVGSGSVPQAGYAASKGGVINLTRELSAQWASLGVRVNAIAPAFFDTEMTAGMWDDERSLKWVRRNTPIGRGGKVNEMQGALIYLASDASSYVTGAVLPVDGGWTSI